LVLLLCPTRRSGDAEGKVWIVSKASASGEVAAVIDFSVVVDGKLYLCDRRVSGIRRTRQTIYVNAVGSMDDPSSYLAAQRSVPVMEEAARMIALEIIYGAADTGDEPS
jgi:hypothetical protein